MLRAVEAPPDPGAAGAPASVFALLAGDPRRAATLAAEVQASLAWKAGSLSGGLESIDAAELVGATALPGDPRLAEQAVTLAHGEFLHGLLDVVVERSEGPLMRAFAPHAAAGRGREASLGPSWPGATASGSPAGCAARSRSRAPSCATARPCCAPAAPRSLAGSAGGYRPPSGFRPTEEVVHLANLAAAAEALGPSEVAAKLGERARRFRQAILRRDTAVPLAVIERLLTRIC